MKRILTLIALTLLISINGWVKSSAIITDWKPLTLNAQFGENYYSATTVSAGVVYMAGGVTTADYVWKSSNGTTWQSVTKNANIDSRLGTLLSYNNKLYLIGAFDLVHATGGVWSSSDLGKTWVDEGPFGFGTVNFMFCTAQVFNNLIYIMGSTADVWTYDGTTFSRITALADYEASDYAISYVYDGKLWRVGGYSGGAQWSKQIWQSTDGIVWTQVINTLSYYPTFHTGVVYNGAMYMFNVNAVYSSVDGQTWSSAGANLESVGYNIGQSQRNQVAVLNGKLIYFNGYDSVANKGIKEVYVAVEGDTPTSTHTSTRTPYPTITNTYTFSSTPTITETPTLTVTKTITKTHTLTWTLTPTKTVTTEIAVSATDTGTFTPTNTITETATAIRTFTQTSTYTNVVIQTFTATPTVTPTSANTESPTPIQTPFLEVVAMSANRNKNGGVTIDYSWRKYPDLGSTTNYIFTVTGGNETFTYYLTNADNLDTDSNYRFLYTLDNLRYGTVYTYTLKVQNPVSIQTPRLANTVVNTAQPTETPTPNGWYLPFNLNYVNGNAVATTTPGVVPVHEVQLPTFFVDVKANTYVVSVNNQFTPVPQFTHIPQATVVPWGTVIIAQATVVQNANLNLYDISTFNNGQYTLQKAQATQQVAQVPSPQFTQLPYATVVPYATVLPWGTPIIAQATVVADLKGNTFHSYVMVVNEAGTPTGVKFIDGKPRVSAMSYPYDIAEGNVAGHEQFQVYGYNADIGTTYEDIIQTGGSYVFVTTTAGVQMRVVSDATADDGDPAGTGVQQVYIQYLDNNWEPQTEIVTMNGVTPVYTTATNILRVNAFGTYAIGSANTTVGTILLREATNVNTYGAITPGNTYSRFAIYTIPNGHTGYITNLNLSATGLKYVRFILRANYDHYRNVALPVNQFFPHYESHGINYLDQKNFLFPTMFPEHTDIKLSGGSDGTGAFAIGRISGWIEAN